MYKKTKYGILVFLFAFSLIFNLKYGDYCSGIADVLGLFFISACFFLTFFVFFIIDLVYFLKSKKKFDFIPILILVFFVSVNFFLFSATKNNYWKSVNIEGNLEDEDKWGNLILFKDNTFKAEDIRTEYYCAFQGKYYINNDTLILDYKDIEDKTENYFTTKYLISDSILQPINGDFSKIRLKQIQNLNPNQTVFINICEFDRL